MQDEDVSDRVPEPRAPFELLQGQNLWASLSDNHRWNADRDASERESLCQDTWLDPADDATGYCMRLYRMHAVTFLRCITTRSKDFAVASIVADTTLRHRSLRKVPRAPIMEMSAEQSR
eukprot:jgi/Botrbrau1/11482/Bobra.0360s0009.1